MEIFNEARKYLLSFPEINGEILNKHLNYWKGKKPKDLNELFKRMVEQAPNRQGMPNSIGEVNRISGSVFGWNYKKVLSEYGSWKELFRAIKKSGYTPPGRMVENAPKSHWAQFCKSVISIAEFVSTFEEIEDFNKFVEAFYLNEKTRVALPLLLSEEIHGYGFALACDSLKENGYPEFVKPDVHIKYLFRELGLSSGKSSFQVFRDVIKFSKSIDKMPYEVDKLFWLVGSGSFYLEDIKINTNKKQFVKQIITHKN